MVNTVTPLFLFHNKQLLICISACTQDRGQGANIVYELWYLIFCMACFQSYVHILSSLDANMLINAITAILKYFRNFDLNFTLDIWIGQNMYLNL